MKTFTPNQINLLRSVSGCGLQQCIAALVQANGDTGDALELLRTEGTSAYAKVAAAVQDRQYPHLEILRALVADARRFTIMPNEFVEVYARRMIAGINLLDDMDAEAMREWLARRGGEG